MVNRDLGPEFKLVLQPVVLNLLDDRLKMFSPRGKITSGVLDLINRAAPAQSQEILNAVNSRLNSLPPRRVVQLFGDLSLFNGEMEFENDLARAKLIFKSVPALIPNLIYSIQDSLVYKIPPQRHITRINLLDALIDKNTKLYDSVLPELVRARVRTQAKSAFTSLDPKATSNILDFVNTKLYKSIYPVDGSSEFSEMAKIFSLVDPVFVTEDLLINNAKIPKLRFNENYFVEGKQYIQPAWENFREAWSHMSLQTMRDLYQSAPSTSLPPMINPGSPVSPGSPGSIGTPGIPNIPGGPSVTPVVPDFPVSSFLKFSMNGSQINQMLLAGYVDQNASTENNPLWTRDKYRTKISDAEWSRYVDKSLASELAKYFTITLEPGYTILQFKKLDDLRLSLPELNEFSPLSQFELPQEVLSQFIEAQSAKIIDPVARMTKILYLMTKLHPFENGNGRMGRMWASIVALQSGLPIPVGLPTNDFLMSEKRMHWEVRRALANGRFYSQMIQDARAQKIDPKDFFSTVYKGSALEGLTHVDVQELRDLKDYVSYLEKQSSPPAWGKEYLKKVQEKIIQLRAEKGTVGKTSEVRRDMAMEDTFTDFVKTTGLKFNVKASTAVSAARERTSGRSACLHFYK